MLEAYSDAADLQTEIAGIEAGIQFAQATTTAADKHHFGAAAAGAAAVAVGFLAGMRGGGKSRATC